MTDPDADVVTVGTPSGEWRLAWDAAHATYTAAHTRGGPGGPVDHRLGVAPGVIPIVWALEETLGFAFPAPLADTLADARAQRPPLAQARGGSVPDPERPRSLDTYPVWASPAAAGGDRWPYGLLIERERPLALADLGDGSALVVLAATLDADAGAQRIAYRLTHAGRVIFAGDDIYAPPRADAASDDGVRALLGVLLEADPTRRARPFTRTQAAFTAAHADRIQAVARPPAHPWPDGTRVAHTAAGQRHTGTVTRAICDRDGAVLAYGWRPDAAALVGHSWRYQPEHTLVSPPGDLTATLGPPERALGDPDTILLFGAVVACAHPEHGTRIEATVLRAFAARDRTVTYQVQAHPPSEAGTFTAPAERCAPVAGTCWASVDQLRHARAAAGIEIAEGELLDDTRRPAAPGEGAVTAPTVTAAQGAAALLVDVDEPAPSVVRVSTHGETTRVGDPTRGWIVVPTDRWLAAMCRTPDTLAAVLDAAAPGVRTGAEPRPTLAALAAHHAPDQVGDVPAGVARRFAGVEPASAGVGL